MQNYLIGFAFFGAAGFVGLKSRGNVDETAMQTFGTLGGILLLVLIGFSFIRSAERERTRGGGKKKKKSYGPPKGVQAPPPRAGAKVGKPQATGGFGTSEGAEKAAYLVLGIAVIGMGLFAFNFFFVKSDFEKLAKIDHSKSVEKGKKRMDPLLDKLADKFDMEREEADAAVLEFWEINEEELRADSLKPSSLCREALGAARKNSEFEALAIKIIQQKPAARLARLHQKKPVFDKYSEEGEFQLHLSQLANKTELDEDEIATTLIRNWKLLFRKKKKSRTYNLLWFVKKINSQTEKMDGSAWKKKVSKSRKGMY